MIFRQNSHIVVSKYIIHVCFIENGNFGSIRPTIRNCFIIQKLFNIYLSMNPFNNTQTDLRGLSMKNILRLFSSVSAEHRVPPSEWENIKKCRFAQKISSLHNPPRIHHQVVGFLMDHPWTPELHNVHFCKKKKSLHSTTKWFGRIGDTGQNVENEAILSNILRVVWELWP